MKTYVMFTMERIGTEYYLNYADKAQAKNWL